MIGVSCCFSCIFLFLSLFLFVLFWCSLCPGGMIWEVSHPYVFSGEFILVSVVHVNSTNLVLSDFYHSLSLVIFRKLYFKKYGYSKLYYIITFMENWSPLSEEKTDHQKFILNSLLPWRRGPWITSPGAQEISCYSEMGWNMVRCPKLLNTVRAWSSWQLLNWHHYGNWSGSSDSA